jgi:hypothetical protein
LAREGARAFTIARVAGAGSIIVGLIALWMPSGQ